jgi:hypothetical protein
MITYTTTIHQFEEKGEKTGWTYIDVPAEIAQRLKPGYKKSFRVKGWLDQLAIHGVSLLPMGEGDFIMPLNAPMRKQLKKKKGEKIKVQLEEDMEEKKIDDELIACLHDEPKALKVFQAMPASHQRYYSNWVTSAKTETTKAKRITKTIRGLSNGLSFAEIIKLDL